tara:strand:- start:1175 stop:1318 length:144 start_codon:yes stop_codon:yes gene_type:complete
LGIKRGLERLDLNLFSGLKKLLFEENVLLKYIIFKIIEKHVGFVYVE